MASGETSTLAKEDREVQVELLGMDGRSGRSPFGAEPAAVFGGP